MKILLMSASDKGGGKRGLTPEEVRLWRVIQKQVTPLHEGQSQEELPDTQVLPTSKDSVKRGVDIYTPPPALRPKVKSAVPCHSFAIDRPTLQKIKRGTMPIERTLDMHGMNREEAFIALHHFLNQSQRDGKKLVLVITGKGKFASEPGVLKSSLPVWLSETDMREFILAYGAAQREDGGDGATYIVLKKRR